YAEGTGGHHAVADDPAVLKLTTAVGTNPGAGRARANGCRIGFEMTAQRALKHIVRERMARTRESYSTAHRQVVGPAAGQHRESALIRVMLSSAGVDLTETMVCGLGGGIGFLYAVFDYHEVGHPLLTIVTQHHPTPWVEAVASHLEVRPTVVTSSAKRPALAKLRTALDAGRPSLIHVSRGLLPWHSDVPSAEGADPYALLVTGSEGEDLLVLDQVERRIDAQLLGDAWAAHRKGRFALTTLDDVGTPDLPGAVARAVATTHAHLTGPVLGHAFDVNFGLSGMGRLTDDLADTSTSRGWARRFGAEPAFGIAMARLAECLTSAHGSPGATRLVYADFLAQVGRGEAAALSRKAGGLWSGIADVAAVATDPGVAIPELARRVSAVCGVERRLAQALRG
ncbi:MAG: BtrH N-terminal domain-containing protein, partial [Ornithinimicrobium sp.]